MAKQNNTNRADETLQVIDLRDRRLAAFLAWLVPGLGHFYQRRTAKGLIFSIPILVVFFWGLFLGEGRVVYAAWNQQETRWQYIFQVGVGVPALPALVQAQLVKSGKQPLFSKSRFMVPPTHGPGELNELHQLNYRLNRYFELGTVYTMIAGLLNMLVIYDAFAGPAYLVRRGKEDDKDTLPGADPAQSIAAGHTT